MIVYHSAGDAPVSRKKLFVQFLSHILGAGVVSYLLSPHRRDVLEAHNARRSVGSLWMVRHQFYLLELVGISECLFFLRKAWTWLSVGHWPALSSRG